MGAGQGAGNTRVLDTAQRDALLRVAAVGIWRHDGSYVRHAAEGRYRTYADHPDLVADVPHDSGTCAATGGVLTHVSEGASSIRAPSEQPSFDLSMSDADTVHVAPLRRMLECPRYRSSVSVVRYVRVVDG